MNYARVISVARIISVQIAINNSNEFFLFSRNIGFALVSRKYGAGTEVTVNFDGQEIKGQLTELPFDL